MDGSTIELRSRTVAAVCTAVLALLVLIHGASQVVRFMYGREYQMGLEQAFYLGSERSVPNWFSSVLMLACAGALFAIGSARRDRNRPYWLGLGVVFVAMSIDEEVGFHDLTAPFFYWVFQRLTPIVGGPFHGLINKPGYAWMVPGIAFAALVAAACWPFLRRLPGRYRDLFLLSGAVFLIGEVGFEILGGWYSGLWGPNHPKFVMLSTCKETLKRAGTILFLYSLLSYAESEFGPIGIRIGSRRRPPDPAAESAP